MKILYIYPHPDDESFGPAQAMHKQIKEGHEVYLLTLTKGGATKQRFRLNKSIEEMGEIRHKEMLCVEKVLGLSGMTVLDLPDSGLKEMDPREIERVIKDQIEKIKPDVIASYAVHGISGFHDHLITHAVVKRVFVEMKETTNYLKRFAMVTITEKEAEEHGKHFHLNGSKPGEIDCIIKVEKENIEAALKALDCYETYKEMIEKSGVKNTKTGEVAMEIYRENFEPPLNDIFERLK